jgi:hypothetical protein
MRTGKRRSATVIISRGLPGIAFVFCSVDDATGRSRYRAVWAFEPAALLIPGEVARESRMMSPTNPI